MANPSSMSDQELMSQLNQLTGQSSSRASSQTTQSNPETSSPQSMSDQELLGQINRLEQSNPIVAMDVKTTKINNKSPLSLVERTVLSFADDPGRRQFLEQRFPFVERLPNGKYAVGNDPKQLFPIDPEGMFNDVLGDIADVVSEIPVIAGQITGAVSGAFGTGGVGTVVGGAAGAATGQTISTGIGNALGVRGEKPLEQATDIVAAGLFGTAGEGLGQALKFGGRGLHHVAKNSFDKAVAQSPDPSKTLQFLGKTFRLTASVQPDDVIVAGTYGFNHSLAPKYMNETYSGELMSKFAKGIVIRNKALGRMVDRGNKWAIANHGSKKIDSFTPGAKLMETLSDPRVGLVTATGRVNKEVLLEPTDQKAIKAVTDFLFSKNPKTGQVFPKNITIKQALDFRERSRPLLNQYFNSTRVNNRARVAFAKYFDDINRSISETTSRASNVSTQVNPFVKANRMFSEWKSDLDLLKQQGLNVDDVSDLKGMFRNGKLISQKIENFFERFKIKNSSAQQAFAQVADKLPVRFPGGGVGRSMGTLTDELRKFNAAQGFKNANPNFIRMASIGSMIGVGAFLSRNDPKGAAITGALGLTLGTPAGVRLILKTGDKASNRAGFAFANMLKQAGAKEVAPAAQRAMISRLMDQSSSAPNRLGE